MVQEVVGFDRFLQDHRNGASAIEIQRELEKLVRAVVQTGKSGTITYKVTVKAVSELQIAVTDQVATKMPQPDRATAIYFATEDGDLSRNDPMQYRLPEMDKVNA